MAQLTLLIAQRANSESSFQAWLTVRQAGLIFDVETCSSREDVASFHVPSTTEPPILLVDGVPIWGTLAIGEFLAEHVPGLWPRDPRARALARSVASEAVCGLGALRALLPFDVTRRFSNARLSRSVQQDIRRLAEMWETCRAAFGKSGPYLFGDFSIADAVHAGPAMRLLGNSVGLSGGAAAYLEALASLPSVLEWGQAAMEDRVEAEHDRPNRNAPEVEIPAFASPAERGPSGPHSTTERPRSDPGTYDATIKPIGAGTRRRH